MNPKSNNSDFIVNAEKVIIKKKGHKKYKVKLIGANSNPDCDGFFRKKQNHVDVSPNTLIQTFFKDGEYTMTGTASPSCTYPSGLVYAGDATISSTFTCNDKSQPFHQKNIVRRANITRVSMLTFNIYNYSTHTSTGGTAFGGPYYIDGNKLYVDGTGYTDPVGIVSKDQKLQNIFELTPDGFFYHGFYLDNCNKYQKYITQKYTLKTS